MKKIKEKFEQKAEPFQLNFLSGYLSRSFCAQQIDISDGWISYDVPEEFVDESLAFVRNARKLLPRLTKKTIYDNCPSSREMNDPFPELQARGDVIPLAAGLFAYQGDFLRVLQSLDQRVLDIARRLNAIEQEYPALWPVDLLQRINYLKEFPQNAILGAASKKDRRSLQAFAQRGSEPEIDLNHSQGLDNVKFSLAAAVCDTCYYILRDREDISDHFYTFCNKVYRNETSAHASLDRLTCFTMREIVFTGHKEFVQESHALIKKETIEFFKKMGLWCKMETAVDPFFGEEYVIKNILQHVSELKFEILFPLDFRDSFLAVSSVNLHLDFFGKTLKIQTQDKTRMHSGCWGVGFERLAYALFCQYGLDVNEWPQNVKIFLFKNEA